MKKILVFLMLSPLAAAYSAGIPDEAEFNAMQDEMSRTMAKLKMDAFQKPYFAAYRVTNLRQLSVNAAFGGVNAVYAGDRCDISAELRVGSPQFDNTHFIRSHYGMRNFYEPSRSMADIGGDYDSVRYNLWMATDMAYKKALETLAQKKAYVEKKNIFDLPADFSPERSYESIKDAELRNFDKDAWSQTARAASSVFKRYSWIQDSSVSINLGSSVSRYLNSEKSAWRAASSSVSIRLRGKVQAPDGYTVEEEREYNYANPGEALFGQHLEDAARKLADELTALARSATETAYVGPALFEGQAAARLFVDYLAAKVVNPREFLFEDDRSEGAAELRNRTGMRVMAQFLSVDDDPLLDKYGSLSLAGSYEADAEGVPARRIELVKRGKLNELPMSRSAMKGKSGSNGHARGKDTLPVAYPSNLLVNPSVATSPVELKARLVKMCKDLDMEYGYIVRYMNNFGDKSFSAYRIYASDGREEPVHGLAFENLTARVLRDILAASSEKYVYNAYLDGDVPVSVIAPSVLVGEVELKHTDEKPERAPYLANPYFDKR